MSDFWARRKAAVEAEAVAEVQAAAEAEVALREAEQDALTDEELLEQLELPDPETLKEGDDFKVFLTDAVPARIRTRALRRLWRVNPVLANVDGLIDYGEDFTDAALVMENMQTAYQVGKGMTAHVEELARQAELDAADVPDEVADDPVVEEDAPEAPCESPDTDASVLVAAAEEQEAVPMAIEEDTGTPVPMGRMRFRFDDTAQM
ncbi:DUF3306 domain-containing protein [Epibacterium sp. SM1979]|uniref:DUF3306 domain-containing protein n=1 Tax=Tritonibacter litoralis TaxID=2662264 RepID=A0A843YFH7_9RHOB|nr:DUF3306 domain-containing protein [Tritonibacter litoralis]MQQ10230.1 DUF3306 domain-containing protein [Tritonibacter litoralis]